MLYLSTHQIIAIHDSIITEYGGAPGVRDKSVVEFAANGCIMSAFCQELYKTPFDKAAFMLRTSGLNHPFVDGNKRTAFITAVTFLELNGYDLTFDQTDAEDFMLSVVTKRYTITMISRFLKKSSKRD